ncbi:imidazole glycerol phosphate synthase subunit HisH [bacterium]|nr:MAG: imidazole glycerol phosphate synthase subunit HisH [bacterium]
MGNLRSVQKGLEIAGCRANVSSDPSEIESASGIVLPGVGAFRDCMANLTKARLVDPVLGAIENRKPFLGICLGMQLLLAVSEEFGVHEGLGVVPGRVVRFPHDKNLKVPHMGWNRVHFSGSSPIFKEIPDASYFYFVHSYYAAPDSSEVVSGRTDYGLRFCSAISTDNVFACQFHPEKSQRWGLKILENFGNIVAGQEET